MNKETVHINGLIIVILAAALILTLGQAVCGEVSLGQSLDAVNAKLLRAEALAQLCHWEYDLTTNTITFSENVTALLGLEDISLENAVFETRVLEHSRETRRQALQNIKGRGTYDVEFQFRHGFDERIVDIHSVGEYDADTNVVFGTFLDITESRGFERELLRTQKRDRFLGVLSFLVQALIIFALQANIRQKKQAQAHLQHNAQRQESLLQVYHHETDSIQALAKFALGEALVLTNSADGCLYLYDFEQHHLTLEVCTNPSLARSFQGLESLKQQVVREQKSICENELQRDGGERCLFLPTLDGGQVVAVIGLANKPDKYHVGDINQTSLMMTTVWSMIARKQSTLLLDEERNRLKATLLSVGEGVITTDDLGYIEMMNTQAEELTGLTFESICGESIDKVFTTSVGDLSPVTQVLTHGSHVRLEPDVTLYVKNNKKQMEISGSVAPIRDSKGSVNGAVLVFRDVSKEKLQRDKIRYLSYHDPLTDLYNRRFYTESLELLDREEQWPLSIIMGDVKGLRLVNDTLGHLVGDQLLKRVGAILQAHCRTHDLAARWGGDEFILLLPKTREQEALALTKRLDQAFASERIASFSISMALGWGTKSHREEDITDAFRNAEKRMYRAKLTGRPSVSNETVQALMGALYERSKREERHSARVSQLCFYLAQEMGLSVQEQANFRLAGLFHDIGKIAIDGDILNKPGKLTVEEWQEMKAHSERGYRILNSVTGMSTIADAVLNHHERWDGSGYPQGLHGNKIPFMARVIAVVDSYDAMISVRPYRRPLSREEAVEELRKCAGRDFDPIIVETFLSMMERELQSGFTEVL